jgi:hypothetical protein
MKPVTLPASHYAADWETEKFNSVEGVNALGREYARHQREDLLLELCRAFHPYLMKYLGTICRGHVPLISAHRTHPDSKKFLQLFLARDERPNLQNLMKVAKGLHLAFKGMETEETYDVLTEYLAARKGYGLGAGVHHPEVRSLIQGKACRSRIGHQKEAIAKKEISRIRCQSSPRF